MELAVVRALIRQRRRGRGRGETRIAVFRRGGAPIPRPQPDAPAPIPFELRPENIITVNGAPNPAFVPPAVIQPAPGEAAVPTGFGFTNVPGGGSSGNVWADIATAGIGLVGQIINRQPAAPSFTRLPPIPNVTLERTDIARQGRQQGFDTTLPAMRRRRRMNVTNSRALRRAMRRVQGFAKFAKKTITFTQRVKMKKTRRR